MKIELVGPGAYKALDIGCEGSKGWILVVKATDKF